MDSGSDVYSINEFCKVYGFSRSFFYKLLKSGEGPDTIKIRTRRMITKEAGKRWRRKLENTANVA